MIYLPIKEASKYIKRETGIKLPVRTIADFAYCDDINVYVSGSYLEAEGFNFMKASYDGLVKTLSNIAHERYPEIMKPFDEKHEIEQFVACDVAEVLYRKLLTRYIGNNRPYYKLILEGGSICHGNFLVNGVVNNDIARPIRAALTSFYDNAGGEYVNWLRENIHKIDIECEPFRTMIIRSNNPRDKQNQQKPISYEICDTSDWTEHEIRREFPSVVEIDNFCMVGCDEVFLSIDDVNKTILKMTQKTAGKISQPNKASRKNHGHAVESEIVFQNRKLLIKLMLDAIKNYNQVLELAGKKQGDKIAEINIINYIEESYPELKGKGVAKRQLEKIFAEVKKQ